MLLVDESDGNNLNASNNQNSLIKESNNQLNTEPM